MSAALFSMMPDTAPMPVGAPSVAGQLAAFLIIGAAGAAGFVGLAGLFGQIGGIPAWQVNALCYAAMIGPVYLAHRRFSFQSRLPHAQALPRYVAVQLLALALVALFSAVVYGVLGMTSTGAAIVVIGLTSGLNFGVLRGWAFAASRPQGMALILARFTHE